MESLIICPICSKSSFSLFLKANDYFYSHETFQILACDFCGFKFTNPRPEENEINKYYYSDDYISHSNSNKGLLNISYQIIRKFTISYKLKLVLHYKKYGRALDIGCGTGEFLNNLQKNKFEVFGIEPNTHARNYAERKYNIKIIDSDINNMENETFDVITLWHVLEHIHKLNDNISQIKRVIKKEGTLIIAVPNPDSFDSKIYGEFWAAYDLPRHLYHFSKNNVKSLFNKYDFDLIDIKPLIFDSFYISILSEKYKTGKKNIAKAVFNATISNLNAKKSLNYSSLIYIFKSLN
jgi:2-polyprenyl-3-methyl-5-hydroxy-6-metoxy-1,4-benzoquinol methylase